MHQRQAQELIHEQHVFTAHWKAKGAVRSITVDGACVARVGFDMVEEIAVSLRLHFELAWLVQSYFEVTMSEPLVHLLRSFFSGGHVQEARRR